MLLLLLILLPIFCACIVPLFVAFTLYSIHRYVVRAKAGKKQSSKDATGKAAHSAGSSLRRYNEVALKKVQDVFYFRSSCFL